MNYRDWLQQLIYKIINPAASDDHNFGHCLVLLFQKMVLGSSLAGYLSTKKRQMTCIICLKIEIYT